MAFAGACSAAAQGQQRTHGRRGGQAGAAHAGRAPLLLSADSLLQDSVCVLGLFKGRLFSVSIRKVCVLFESNLPAFPKAWGPTLGGSYVVAESRNREPLET